MKNNTYKFLYYLTFITTLALLIYCKYVTNHLVIVNLSLRILGIISAITFIVTNVFIFKNKKFKTNNKDLLLPIIYLVFVFVVALLTVIYNKNAIIPYLHYTYYYTFLLIPYILLNIYTITLSKKG